MSTVIQVRDVPDAVHEELVRQAQHLGLSMNRFVLRELERIARRGRNAEVLGRAAGRRGPRLTSEAVVAAVRGDRDASG